MNEFINPNVLTSVLIVVSGSIVIAVPTMAGSEMAAVIDHGNDIKYQT